jgi:prepilin-type N-terminal cleavage/methylation domain-containing protein
MRRHRGFTLIEIAMVLVIIGLLLGSVLKGQDLIDNARVRNLAAMGDGLKAAFLGFQDRYRAIPGDYPNATNNINGATVNGDGDGQIEIAGTGTAVREDVAVWEHLSRAGFMYGTYAYAAAPSATSNPRNPWGIALQVVYDNAYADISATPSARHNLKTGSQIPADMLAEVDLKVDDGNARQGYFRFSVYTQGGVTPTAATCHTTGTWIVTGSISSNCGAAYLL